MKKKFKMLLSNTFIFAVGNISVKFISFFLMPLYTSQLTAEQYGIAELLNNSIEIILPVATLCIIDAIFRFSIDEDSNHKVVLSTSLYVLTKSIILIFILSTIIYIFNGYQYTYYFFLLFLAKTVHKLFSQFARGIGYIKRFAISGIINALVLVVMNIILLVFYNGGIESYLISIIISYLVSGGFSFVASKTYLYIDLKYIDRSLLKPMLKFSIPNIPNMLSWWVNNISSRYIILWFCGPVAAGMFTAASKIPSMINLLSTIFQQAWQLSTSKEINNKGSDKFFSEVFKYYSAIIFIGCSFLIAIMPYLSKLILRGDFYEAWKYVPLLLISATLGSFSIYFGTLYTAIKNNFMAMVSTGTGAIISISLNLILVPMIGVSGALISSIIGYLTITLIRLYDTRKYVSIEVNYNFLSIRFIIVLFQAIVLSVGIKFAEVISFVCFLLVLILHIRLIMNVLNKLFKLVRRKDI